MFNLYLRSSKSISTRFKCIHYYDIFQVFLSIFEPIFLSDYFVNNIDSDHNFNSSHVK